MFRNLQLRDKVLLVLFPIFAIIFSVKFINSYPISIILFYGLPGVYISLRFGSMLQIKRTLLFTILFTTPFTIIVDYIGIQSGLWYTPISSLATRFLGTIPWEDFLWMIVGTYTIVIIYETLLSKGQQKLTHNRVLYFILPAAVVLNVFFLILAMGGADFFVFNSKYTYLVLASIFFLLPALLFILKFPTHLKKLLPLIVYFLYLTVLFETTATYLHQWIFTGYYLIQPLSVFGNISIPCEELFFVGIIGPVTAISFYEFFYNDIR